MRSGRGIHRSARRDCVLLGDAVEDLLRGDAERRELGVVELDEDLFRLLADEVDLVDVGNAQEALANVFRARLERCETEAIRCQHVDRGIDVAIFVVEVRPDNAGRQVTLDVADSLADLVPELLHHGRRCPVDQEDLDEGDAGLRIGFHPVEIGQFLQLLLDHVGDLRLHLGRSRAGPRDVHDHGLDGEGRIFGAPEVEVGIGPCPAEDQDHEQHERAVRDRPFGQIEAHHGAAPVNVRRWCGPFDPRRAPARRG
jgi:hypothetical protein